MAALVLTGYPETAHRELEDINPEDRLEPDGAHPPLPPAATSPVD
jgi:hypothetical protein